MNPIFQSFLREISELNTFKAYSLLDSNFDDFSDKKIAEALRQVMTSHFIRERSTKLKGLSQLKIGGFLPDLVIDVGAQVGTPELYTIYPESHHIFIEPVEECIEQLNIISKSLKKCDVINAAASNFCGNTALSITPSRQYSSISDVISNESRNIQVITVDSILESVPSSDSILLKIDVDGAEINVLQGSKKTLNKDTIVVIEASMGDSSPRFGEIVEYMNDFGYSTYDIVDPLYRPNDWHLWQVDLIFAKKNSTIWGSKTDFS
jgi:FkbM family methyltransferase